jgi:adenine-specific DNA-methyltransferase
MIQNEITEADAFDFLRQIPDSTVDLILTDPPYNGVKADETWDNQWSDNAEFVNWMGKLFKEYRRVLKFNGSLYVFTAPRAATDIEIELRKTFRVLNRISWTKADRGGNGIWMRTDPESLRAFFSQQEVILFGEQYEAAAGTKEATQHHLACDGLRGDTFKPIREYLRKEWELAGLKPMDANLACGTRSMAGRHYFTRSQWCFPTEEHYKALQKHANRFLSGGKYLDKDYGELKTEYEFLKKSYDELKKEYEGLRRTFNSAEGKQLTDVWDFTTVSGRPGKHPCEKPTSLLRHIIDMSSKPGDIVLDTFAGSGSTATAAMELGRRFIGCENDPEWVKKGNERIKFLQPRLFF